MTDASVPIVDFRLPAMLKVAVGKDRLKVRGRDLPEAFEAAYAELPQLRHHLTLESGELRPHILCILNGESVQRNQFARTGLANGDEIWVHQAISGG